MIIGQAGARVSLSQEALHDPAATC
jgi:hypothetical protein